MVVESFQGNNPTQTHKLLMLRPFNISSGESRVAASAAGGHPHHEGLTSLVLVTSRHARPHCHALTVTRITKTLSKSPKSRWIGHIGQSYHTNTNTIPIPRKGTVLDAKAAETQGSVLLDPPRRLRRGRRRPTRCRLAKWCRRWGGPGCSRRIRGRSRPDVARWTAR